MENELWNLKVKGTNLTTYNQRFQELILLYPEMVPNTNRLLERYIEGLPLNIKGNVTSSKLVDLHEAIEMAQGLMYQVVQDLTENSGDKRKWNGNHYNNSNANNTRNFNPNKRPKMARVFTVGQGQGIKPKNAELHLVLQAKEDPEPKEDWVVMLPASDAVKRGITRTSVQTMETKSVVIKFEVISTNLKTIKSKETPEETTKPQPATKEEAKHSAEYTICVQKLLYRTTKLSMLGSFDVIIGMDWMSKHHAKVVCHEKYIRIPYRNEVLVIRGERSRVRNESRLEVISSIRTQRYIEKGCRIPISLHFIQSITKSELERRKKELF
ncbi:hypothetical protein Tco_0141014 [Tanacetum coccineum]